MCFALLSACGARSDLDRGLAADDGGAVVADASPAPGPDAAAEVDAGAPGLARPSARFPWNGFATGSVWARTSLRPTFQWEPVAGATSYELRLDDDCASNASCDFPSPELFTVTETRVSLDRALDVDRVAPVGRRYYWAVRACRRGACSAWSETRYLDVGRQRADYDGDGYADLVVSATRVAPDGLEDVVHFVFAGSAAGLGARAAIEIHTDTAHVPSNVGDLDADGFADFALMTLAPPEMDRPRFGALAQVHRGSRSGLTAAPSFVLAAAERACAFAASLVGPGDLNGDGYADLAVGTQQPHTCSGDPDRGPAVQVFHGGADGLREAAPLWVDGPFSASGRTFYPALGGVGDVDGDGFPDLLVGIVDFLEHRPALLFRGGKGGLSASPSVRVEAEPGLEDERFYFPHRIPSVGDVDGDGFADVVAVRRPAYDVDPAGAVHVYYGSAAGPPERPSATLDGAGAEVFAEAISGGDFDDDGLSDIVFGVGTREEQHLRVHLGAPTGLSPTATHLEHAAPSPDRRGPVTVSSPGDFDGDGSSEVVEGAPFGAGPGTVSIWPGSSGGAWAAPIDLPSPVAPRRAAFGAMFSDSTF